MKNQLLLLLAVTCSNWAVAGEFSPSRLRALLLSETHAPDLFASLEVPRSGGGPEGSEKRERLFQSLDALARGSSEPTLRRAATSVLGEVIGVISESDPDSVHGDALKILGGRLSSMNGAQFEDDRFGIYDGLARSGQPEAWLELVRLGTAQGGGVHEAPFVLSHVLLSLEIPMHEEQREKGESGPLDSQGTAEFRAAPHLLLPFRERKTAKRWSQAFAEAESLLEARERSSEHLTKELGVIKKLIGTARESIENSGSDEPAGPAELSKSLSNSSGEVEAKASLESEKSVPVSAFTFIQGFRIERILGFLALSALLGGIFWRLIRFRAGKE